MILIFYLIFDIIVPNITAATVFATLLFFRLFFGNWELPSLIKTNLQMILLDSYWEELGHGIFLLCWILFAYISQHESTLFLFKFWAWIVYRQLLLLFRLWIRYSVYDTLCYLSSQCMASNIFIHFDVCFPLGGIFLKWNYWIRKNLNGYSNIHSHIVKWLSWKTTISNATRNILISKQSTTTAMYLYVDFCSLNCIVPRKILKYEYHALPLVPLSM